jgi:hypothetical protein
MIEISKRGVSFPLVCLVLFRLALARCDLNALLSSI